MECGDEPDDREVEMQEGGRNDPEASFRESVSVYSAGDSRALNTFKNCESFLLNSTTCCSHYFFSSSRTPFPRQTWFILTSTPLSRLGLCSVNITNNWNIKVVQGLADEARLDVAAGCVTSSRPPLPQTGLAAHWLLLQSSSTLIHTSGSPWGEL